MKKYLLLICWFGLSVCNAQSLLKETDSDWESDSFLQTFVDLDPIGKQVHVYEDVIKIKPQTVKGTSSGATRLYSVKGCNLVVDTDKHGNVNSYKLMLGKRCPQFNLSHDVYRESYTSPHPFNSRNTLQNILNEYKVKPRENDPNGSFCVEKTFDVTFVWGGCGTANCHLRENTLTIAPSCNARRFHKKLTYNFDSNNGVDKWVETIKNVCDYYKLFDTEKFFQCMDRNNFANNLAEKLWSDVLPTHITVSNN
jgi:hypothetical protein